MRHLKALIVGGGIGLVCAGANAADVPTAKGAPPSEPTTSCFASFYSFISASAQDCPLSWWGITLYGKIDVGAGYSSHGANLNRDFPQGVQEVISKFSQGPKYQLVPSALTRSHVGVKGDEPFAPGWSLVFNARMDFDPYTLHISNGPKSLVENNDKTIGNQNANGDSSRAGQFDTTQGYIGVSNVTLGTLTIGRHNSLSDDLVGAYDAMGSSNAFSLIGNSSTLVSGVGDTETARYNTSLRYEVGIQNFHAAAVWQFGGYNLGNGSNGAYQFELGGDYRGLSVDAIYSHATDAVSLSTFAVNPLPAGVTQDDLKATLANIDGAILAAKYAYGPFKFFGGYEYARFSPPSDAFPNGFETLGGFTVLPGSANVTNFATNKILQVGWVGARYAIRADLDIAGAYYLAHQNNFAPPGSAPSVCGPNTKAPVPGGAPQGALNSFCAGDMFGVSGLIDYRPVERLDVYAGVMFTQVTGGFATGFIHSNNIDPTIGVRLTF